jgi:DNA-directed RNA polymerase specialized sigma24 family protein
VDAETLQKLQEAHERAAAAFKQTREERDAAILAAIEADWSYSRIAEATGLNRSRIGQIALGQ